MPAAIIVVAAAASGVAAAIGGAVVAAITTATISTAVAAAIGTGVIAGGITAIQGGSTSDVLKSAVLSGVGSYVGGQVASKVTNSVSAATGGTAAGSGLVPGAAGTTGLTAGAAGTGLTAGTGAASSFVTPTTIGITAGAVAGRSVQAAITGQPIEEAVLFGLASSIPVALNESADFRRLDRTTKNVITASVQSAVMGQDIPEAAVSALVQSSNIVAKAIREVPGGDKFIRNNPTYARYVIDSVSSALTAELLNKDVSDAVINSLARTTGQLLAQEFENSQRADLVSQSKTEYEQLAAKERELLMVQEQLEALSNDRRYANAIKNFENASTSADHYYSVYTGAADDAKHYEKLYNDAEKRSAWAGEAQVKKQQDRWANLYKQSVERANAAAAKYENYAPGKQRAYDALAATGYFDEQSKIVRQYNGIKSEYDTLLSSVTATANELAKSNADLFNATSQETLAEIEKFAALEEVQPLDFGNQYAQGFRVDIGGTATPLFKTPDNRFVIYENLELLDLSKEFDDPAYRLQLTPEEFRDITGMDYQQALASNRVAVGELGGAEVPVEDIAGIPSFTGTPEAEAAQLGFVIGVDLRREASPQTAAGKAIYRPADVSGVTGTGGAGTSTFQIIGRDRATGAEKVDVDGEGFTLIALPNNRQALVSDTREVILYPYKDPYTNEINLIERLTSEAERELALAAGGRPTARAEEALIARIIIDEANRLEQELQKAEERRQEVQSNLARAQEQTQRFTQRPDLGRISPETRSALDAEIRALENQLAQSSRETETAAAEIERFGALQQEGRAGFTDEDIARFLELGDFPGGPYGTPVSGLLAKGTGVKGEGVEGEGAEGVEGEGAEGVEGGAGGGELEEGLAAPTTEEELPQATVSLGPEIPGRPETLPFASRVTGQALEGILGEKEPLFGGDDDEQRAVWNRRSLKLLSRALGL
jgi:hypothetical protein